MVQKGKWTEPRYQGMMVLMYRTTVASQPSSKLLPKNDLGGAGSSQDKVEKGKEGPTKKWVHAQKQEGRTNPRKNAKANGIGNPPIHRRKESGGKKRTPPQVEAEKGGAPSQILEERRSKRLKNLGEKKPQHNHKNREIEDIPDSLEPINTNGLPDKKIKDQFGEEQLNPPNLENAKEETEDKGGESHAKAPCESNVAKGQPEGKAVADIMQICKDKKPNISLKGDDKAKDEIPEALDDISEILKEFQKQDVELDSRDPKEGIESSKVLH